MKTSQLRSLAFALAAAAALPALPDATAAAPAHLTTALTLSEQIRTQGEAGVFTNSAGVLLNRYGGSWSGTNASFYALQGTTSDGLPMNHTMCAPLISRLLIATSTLRFSSHTFFDPVQNKNVKTASPFPYQMMILMDLGKGFTTSFTDLDLAQPGDILCLSRPSNPTDDHAALFVEAYWDDAVDYPSDAASANPDYTGARFVPILVVDSTSTDPNRANGGLHALDSRRFELGGGVTRFTPGVGTGVMGVLIDAQGGILGHTWSLPTDGDPTSDDAAEVNDWVEDLHDRLETQSGNGAREMLFGRPAI